MQPNTNGFRPGGATLLGFVLGTFLGLLFGKLALGMIFGFFIGAAVEAARRKKASSVEAGKSDDKEKA
jgi:F0F1-type ATP synthase assembly protein I